MFFCGFLAGEYNSHSFVLRRSTSPDVEGNRLAYSFTPIVFRAVQEDALGHVGIPVR